MAIAERKLTKYIYLRKLECCCCSADQDRKKRQLHLTLSTHAKIQQYIINYLRRKF